MSPQETQRSRDIARAALMYTAIHGALKAASGPMTVAELSDMTAIAQLYHKRLLGQKVHAQLYNLIKDKEVVRVERGKYWVPKKDQAQTVDQHQMTTPEMSLRLQVNKSDKSISFVFQKLSITIKVVE